MSVGPAQSHCNRSIQYFSADPSASYVGSDSAPWTGHVSGRVVCGKCLITGCITSYIHGSLVRIRLGGPENVEKSFVQT
ncbi:hypothetical protein T4B_10079 [Trichinella pseudospiralis]|uniref:Uncharacterized protein n=1 Tax=Trichinella pseudospiralis TaxID=6337 RepID=A0A0V1JDL3_TRIPS|nr:hypothetical protein T4B_10079 [Trichinella pseudospiralis]